MSAAVPSANFQAKGCWGSRTRNGKAKCIRMVGEEALEYSRFAGARRAGDDNGAVFLLCLR